MCLQESKESPWQRQRIIASSFKLSIMLKQFGQAIKGLLSSIETLFLKVRKHGFYRAFYFHSSCQMCFCVCVSAEGSSQQVSCGRAVWLASKGDYIQGEAD